MKKQIIYAAGIAHYWKNLNDEVQSYCRCQQLGMDVSDNEERVVDAWNEIRDALLNSEARPAQR